MSTRKDFIATIASVAAAPTAPPVRPAPTVAPAPIIKPAILCPHGTTRPAELTFTFDRPAFDEILSRPAKHKQCFGVTNIAQGAPLEGMNNTIDAYENYLHEAPGSVQTVAVLYHGNAIAFALNNTVWNELLIPLLRNAPHGVRKGIGDFKGGKGNPYLRSGSGDVSVERLVGKGASFFVCHNAIVGFSQMVGDALKISSQKAHAEILAGIVPGALVVPAGVMAVNACQEAKFTYIASS